MPYTQIIAHRGSKGTHPENTMPAFLHAVDIDADGIELDVQLTKDSELVVIHDETVDRTTDGKGYVQQFSLKELKQLDAGLWFAEKYAGTRIPTLKEVLHALKEHSFQGLLNIELKTDRFTYTGIEEKVVDVLRSEDWPFRVVLSSFNEETLARLMEEEPALPLAFLFKKKGEETTHIKGKFPLAAWHPKITWVKHASLSQLSRLPVRVWTVNRKRDMIQCFQLSVDALITDFPEKAMEVRKKHQRSMEEKE